MAPAAATAACTTRPSASAVAAEAAAAPAAAELRSLRAARGRAYRERQGVCCRRYHRLGCFIALVTAPLFMAAAAARCALLLCLTLLRALLSGLLRPHFWLGAGAALAAGAGFASTHCAQSPGALTLHAAGPGAVRYVCESDHPWVLQAHEATWTALALASQGRAVAQQLLDEFKRIGDAALYAQGALLWPIFGWCPYWDAEDARAICGRQPEFQAVRRAESCALLRRAFHNGQRQFHPDHLRTRHPACDAQVLEACSIALNAAMEARRAELSCPGR